MSVVWTHINSPFLNIAVAIRKAIALYQQQNVKSVCAAQAQSRDLNHCGLKTDAEVLTNNCCEFNKRGRVQEEKSVLCDGGNFTRRNQPESAWDVGSTSVWFAGYLGAMGALLTTSTLRNALIEHQPASGLNCVRNDAPITFRVPSLLLRMSIVPRMSCVCTFSESPRRGGAPKGGGPKGGRPEISRFFSLSRRKISFFSSLSGGLLVEFWWCLKRRDAQMCLGLSCASPGGPVWWGRWGFTRQPESPNEHI